MMTDVVSMNVSVTAVDDGRALPACEPFLAGETHYPELHTVRDGCLALGTDCTGTEH